MDLALGPATISLIVDEGLGNTCHLLDAGDGRALVVDPPRDLRAVREAARRRGLRIDWAADTHLHADFLSGARQLAADTGATVVAPAREGRSFDHHGMDDGDELDLGGLRLQAMASPGHTPGHCVYVLRDGSHPLGVFTGGSLLVGAVARTDLVSPDRTVELARAQYRSVRALLELPDETAVLPTHGAGSFCSSPPGAERTSTIGRERVANPLAAAEDEDAFLTRLLDSLSTYPGYFARLPEINRRGPAVLGEAPGLRRLSVADLRHELASGTVPVDVRPAAAFGEAHIPGALSIPLRPAFATWLGWLVPGAARIVMIRDADQDPDEIVWPALKIGYDDLAGELDGGMAAWTAGDRAVAHIRVLAPSDAADADVGAVVDVRQDSEFEERHIPGAVHAELGTLTDPGTAREITRGRRLLVMCAHGERAMSAASLLSRAGGEVSVLAGGPEELARAGDLSLAAGA